MKILSFGELLLRLASPGYTKLFQNNSLDVSFCGGEANVAVSLAQFGLNSSFISVLPNNDVGRAGINTLNYFGVDTTKVIFKDGRMGTYYLEKGASQRPSKIIYDRENSAFSLATKELFDWEKIFDGIGWFHWTGINPALSKELIEICYDACNEAKKRGIRVSCDLNYRKNLWSSDSAKLAMAKLMPYVDVCIANEEDVEKVLGIEIRDNDIELGKLNKRGYEIAAKEIAKQYGCEYVAFTLRESFSASRNGWSAMLYDKRKSKAYYSTTYDIQIVDRVGSGDSFAAGIIYGLLSKKNNQEILEFSVAASCLKHTIEGDFNRISVLDVESLLATGGSGRVQR